MVRLLVSLIAAASVLSPPAFAADPAPSGSPVPGAYPIDAPLEGPESAYTTYLLYLAKNWPSTALHQEVLPGPLQLRCLGTPGNDDYIGVEQKMRVHAPLEAVEKVLDDFGHYVELFPGYAEIKEVSRDRNLVLTYWEQKIPLFFIPNVKYDVLYLLDKSSPDRRIYRYKLKRSKSLKKSDGLIVIERDAAAPGVTRYVEFDFFDADWGLLKTVAPSRIWKDSVEGIYLSDVDIQLKAEHPEWSYDRVADEGKKLLERHPIDVCIREKTPFKP